jgi:hypothetical protein
MQKIYPLGKAPLAFSFLGAARLGSADREGTEAVLFDFIAEFLIAAQTTSAKRYTTLQRYIEGLSRSVSRRLTEALERGNITLPGLPSKDHSEPRETIVVVNVTGYHARVPGQVKIQFFRKHSNAFAAEVTKEPVNLGSAVVHCFPEIAHRIKAGDPSLDQYRQTVTFDKSYSDELAGTVVFSRTFIAACSGPEAAKIDPEISASIGGRIHIATITPADGFRWVPQFEPR